MYLIVSALKQVRFNDYGHGQQQQNTINKNVIIKYNKIRKRLKFPRKKLSSLLQNKYLNR